MLLLVWLVVSSPSGAPCDPVAERLPARRPHPQGEHHTHTSIPFICFLLDSSSSTTGASGQPASQADRQVAGFVCAFSACLRAAKKRGGGSIRPCSATSLPSCLSCVPACLPAALLRGYRRLTD